jgi:deoxyhypusine synthase
MSSKSCFASYPDLIPPKIVSGLSIPELVQAMENTSFEARNLARGARLFERMIKDNDVIWLGIAGAGIAGGMGGMVVSLLEAGFIDVICSTGAQIYHDLHFAFNLPVKAIPPRWNDDKLREHGDTRIYDIGIREKETLEAQDAIIRRFVEETYANLSGRRLSSWEINHRLGVWAGEQAAYPERSFLITAARLGVPVFWDSFTNHSIAMNFARSEIEGFPLDMSLQKDIFDSAAIVYSAGHTGFVELGGGGPKNFIQQTGPTLSQFLGLDFKGADRGLQIGTASEREGSLSGCTFGEAVTWGKYKSSEEENLVQIWGEYSLVFPILSAYVMDVCGYRSSRNLAEKFPVMIEQLKSVE